MKHKKINMKCPKCGKVIDYLVCESDMIKIGRFDGKKYEVVETVYNPDGKDRYYCSECDELLDTEQLRKDGIL